MIFINNMTTVTYLTLETKVYIVVKPASMSTVHVFAKIC